MRLLNETTGELFEGRCKSTNQCVHCRKLAAIENSELLHLDAMQGTAPLIWAVLGTRTATLETKPFYNARRLVLRALRRRWPAAEYASSPEFTTGYGTRSGGVRRPHFNVLLKGIPLADLEECRAVIVTTWCRHIDALPQGQWVAEITGGAGLVRYLSHHFAKTSQEPPGGWKGHRLTMSRGYLWKAAPEARKEARESLARKRALHHAEHVLGLQGEAIADYADAQRDLYAGNVWRLLIGYRAIRRHEDQEHDELDGSRPAPRDQTPAAARPDGQLRASGAAQLTARRTAKPSGPPEPGPTAAPAVATGQVVSGSLGDRVAGPGDLIGAPIGPPACGPPTPWGAVTPHEATKSVVLRLCPPRRVPSWSCGGVAQTTLPQISP